MPLAECATFSFFVRNCYQRQKSELTGVAEFLDKNLIRTNVTEVVHNRNKTDTKRMVQHETRAYVEVTGR